MFSYGQQLILKYFWEINTYLSEWLIMKSRLCRTIFGGHHDDRELGRVSSPFNSDSDSSLLLSGRRFTYVVPTLGELNDRFCKRKMWGLMAFPQYRAKLTSYPITRKPAGRWLAQECEYDTMRNNEPAMLLRLFLFSELANWWTDSREKCHLHRLWYKLFLKGQEQLVSPAHCQYSHCRGKLK